MLKNKFIIKQDYIESIKNVFLLPHYSIFMNEVYLSLGSNIGDRLEYLSKAIDLIGQRIGNILKKSSIYETEPWGFTTTNLFLNQVIIIYSSQSPTDILREIQLIEKDIGRIKTGLQYSSRVIDIDILLFNDLVVESPNLIIPHPHLHKRNFVLVPLSEISPELIHPIYQITIKELTLNCLDKSYLNIYQKSENSKLISNHEV